MGHFKVYILALFLMISYSIQAQFNTSLDAPFRVSKPEDINLLKKRSVVVALETEDPSLLKKFQNYPEELQAYKDEIMARNQALREAVTEYWTFTEQPQYLGMPEALQLRKVGKAVVIRLNTQGIFSYRNVRTPRYSRGVSLNASGARRRNLAPYLAAQRNEFYNPATRRYRKSNEVGVLEILVSQADRGLITTYLPSEASNKRNLVYGIQQIQYVLNYLEQGEDIENFKGQLKENHLALEDKILLMAREDLADKMDEAAIQKIYPYPFEICDREKIEGAILSQSPNYAYVQLIRSLRSQGNMSNHYIAGAEDGKIYVIYATDPRLQVTQYDQRRPRITKKHLRFYAKPKYY